MAGVFQPRFVDLVRNYTTTTGIDDFVLGPAVNGFADFAAACQVGDSFYYSATGVDTPAETEVGRGTLLAGRVISRDPIGGTKTDFSSGTKSLALIAAAEWFAAADAAIGTTARAATSAADRGALAALAPGEVPALLFEAGREGTFVFDSSDRSAQVSADTQQGLFIAPASDPTGASGAWVRKFSGPADFRWFGAVADCTAAGTGTDNTPIFDAARAALIAAGKGWLHIPQQPAAYRFATAPAEIHDGILISGEGWHENPGQVGSKTFVGVQAYPGTVLCFDEDVAGLRFVGFTDNPSNATELEFQSATGSIVRDLMLYSPGGVGTTSHGIANYIQLHLQNVRVEGFAGCGVFTSGDDSGTTLQYGNAAGSEYNGVSCRFNKLHGFYVEGNNGSVIRFLGCDAAVNGGCGYLDKGPFGNSYFCCHASSNNASFGTPFGYSADQTSKAVSDWPGLSDQSAGSYVTTSAVAAHIFSGCYTETGLGSKAEILAPASVMSGVLASIGAQTANFTAVQYDSAQIVNLNAITADTTGVIALNGKFALSAPTGNATMTMTGPGTFSQLSMRGAGSAANGLDILAGQAAAYLSADTINFRNAAQATSYGSLGSSGLRVSAGSIGYGAGAGGAVAQATSKSTGVALNKACGRITMNAAALAASATVSFTLANSLIAAGDLLVVNHVSGGTLGAYQLSARGAVAGSVVIDVRNATAASLAEPIVIGFALIKAVAA